MNRSLVCSLLVATAVGCSSPASDVTSATQAISTRDEVHVRGRFVDYQGGAPLAAVAVCVDGAPSSTCVQTDADGAFDISVAGRADAVIVTTKDTYVDLDLPLHVEADDIDVGTFHYVSRSLYNGLIHLLGGVVDSAKGIVMCNVLDAGGQGIDGATIGVGADTSPTPHITYSGTNQLPDASLSATTVAGNGLVSIGQVSPQTLDLTVHSEGRSCHPVLGWSSSNATIRVPARAASITASRVVCE